MAQKYKKWDYCIIVHKFLILSTFALHFCIMKKIVYLLCLFLALPLISKAQYHWEWAKAPHNLNPRDTIKYGGEFFTSAISKSGYIYAGGTMDDSAVYFDTIYVRAMTTTRFKNLVAKYDTAGNCKWVTQFPGISMGRIVIDQNSNLYCSGTLYTGILYAGSDTIYNTHVGSYGRVSYIVKIDSNGHLIWAKGIDAAGLPEDLAIDTFRNRLYVAGSFQGRTLVTGADTLHSNKVGGVDSVYYSIFLSKMDFNGNFLWSRCASGRNYDFGWGVAVDPHGAPVLCGYTQSDTTQFSTLGVTTNCPSGSIHPLLAKYDTSGSIVWATSANVVLSTGTTRYFAKNVSVVTDDSSNIYTVGSSANPQTIFDSDTLTGKGGYIAKYNSRGILQNVKLLSSTPSANVVPFKVQCDSNQLIVNGQILATTVTFDSITMSDSVMYSNDAAFIAVLDSNMRARNLFCTAFGGDDDFGVVRDKVKNIYMASDYRPLSSLLSAYCTTGVIGSDTLAPVILENQFIAKLAGPWTYCENKPYAGIDTIIVAGDTIHIGQIDTSHNYYWTLYGDTVVIGYGAGLNISPDSTTKYVLHYIVCEVDKKDTIVVTVLPDTSISVNTVYNSVNDINVYPNPTKSGVTVTGAKGFDLSVVEPSGRVCKQIKVDADKVKIDLSALAPGVYEMIYTQQETSLRIVKRVVVVH